MSTDSLALHAGTGATRYVGKRVPRKEDARLLTGRGRFVDDVVLPGMLHCAFVRSPIAHGAIRGIDTDAAMALAGVTAIYTQADLDAVPVRMLSFFLAPLEIAITPLANGRVAYAGEPVALVVAASRAIAEDAASLVEVDYEPADPVVTMADAMRAPPIHPDADDNIAAEIGDEMDDGLAAIFERAPRRIDHRVTHARVSQSPMETRGIVVSPDGPEELTLHITCSSPHMVARWVSMALGLPETAIRVFARDVGGSFGLKNHPWKEECAVIVAGLLLGRPLKWIEDRWEALTASCQAREQEMTLSLAYDDGGTLLGSYADYAVNNGAFPQGADANIAVQMFLWSCYHMPAHGFTAKGWFTNTNGLAAYRGPWAMETLIRETALDRIAHDLGLEPVELRRRNLIRRAELPVTSAMGVPVDDISAAECLDRLMEEIDLPAFRARQAQARKEGRYIGLGIATYVEPTGAAGSIPVCTGELAQIRIEPTGKVSATLSTHSQGHGTATTMAQLIAEELGVRYEDVTVFEGDNAGGGFSPGATGSRQGVIAGGAAIETSRILAGKLRELAAHLLNASPDAIRLEDGMVSVEGAAEMARPLAEIAAIAYGEPDRLPPDMTSGLEAQHRYQPPPMTLTSAAHAAMVELDADTGLVTITRWVSVEDCGTVIHPAVVEGQIAGGLAQAIGTVLLEEMAYDPQGNATAATYKDYLIPTIHDVPQFEFVHANIPSQTTGGMRGVGEGGAIIGPPTLVNAIADALRPFGEVPVNLPLTPTRLMSVIEGRDLSAPEPVPASAATVDPAPAMPRGPSGDAMQVDPAAAIMPGGSAAALAQTASIDGEYDMVLSTPMGPQDMVMRLARDGGTVTGELSSPEGAMEFTGAYDAGRVTFDLKVTKPMKITLKYDLTVTGGNVAGTCKMGIFGKARVKGKKR